MFKKLCLDSNLYQSRLSSLSGAFSFIPIRKAYGEDRSVNELQEYCKELFHVEAALFVTSGMLGNRLALLVQTSPGDEVVIDYSYHINFFDSAATAAVCKVVLNTRHTPQGILSVEEVGVFHRNNRKRTLAPGTPLLVRI